MYTCFCKRVRFGGKNSVWWVRLFFCKPYLKEKLHVPNHDQLDIHSLDFQGVVMFASWVYFIPWKEIYSKYYWDYSSYFWLQPKIRSLRSRSHVRHQALRRENEMPVLITELFKAFSIVLWDWKVKKKSPFSKRKRKHHFSMLFIIPEWGWKSDGFG